MNSTICSLLCVFAPECARILETGSCEEILERNILQEWEKDFIKDGIFSSLGKIFHFFASLNHKFRSFLRL
jgi:hypothetical protein